MLYYKIRSIDYNRLYIPTINRKQMVRWFQPLNKLFERKRKGKIKNTNVKDSESLT